MKAAIKNLLDKNSKTIYNRYVRDKSNVNIVLAQALQQINSHQQLSFPSAAIELIRDCIEKKFYSIKTVKKNLNSSIKEKTSFKRFSTLMDILPEYVPPIEFKAAQEIAIIADSYRSISEIYQQASWAGDVHNHFHISSSFGDKGRILNTIIRIMRCESCLELGTAYGMSALFILDALTSIGKTGHLTTIEGLDIQFSLASKMLNTRYEDRVSCHLGMTQDILPKLVKSMDKIDFMFHDAAHTKEHYIRDFTNVLPILLPGSIIVFDDIRWNAGLFSAKNTLCYEGWMKIIANPRVVWAVEIDKTIGLALLGE